MCPGGAAATWRRRILEKERNKVVTITDSAVQAIKSAIADEKTTPEEAYLRVGVKGGGCSGFSYVLSVDTERRDGDLEIEKDGVRLLIDLKSQVYLAGSTLDFTTGLNGKGFVFTNPNATGTCGCGDSFSI
ncbi:MAG: iron-sulfur cluster insertion protein ErpA [Candidatus Krumholzibacteria bacterium]|nr:iron-sulfur cluster insertion protein ErpA [Candidatus Krumholzibacteria bacterium]